MVPKSTEAINFRLDDARFECPSDRLLAIFRELACFFPHIKVRLTIDEPPMVDKMVGTDWLR